MCRLFGFRSVLSSQVHKSLIGAENALVQQSDRHPDGWGVAYYVAGAPHLVKSSSSALVDSLFRKVSGIVSSETVLAHLRKATVGALSTINTHPFQYGRWVFAHNGNIKNFSAHRDRLLSRIDPALRRYILGDTDSEVIFYLILSKLRDRADIHGTFYELDEVRAAVTDALAVIAEVAGPFCPDDKAESSETFLTFILTDGSLMLAHQGGKQLYYSVHKKRCSERESCSFYAPQCEAILPSGQVRHLIFSSEPLSGENIWQPMAPGQLIALDASMRVRIFA